MTSRFFVFQLVDEDTTHQLMDATNQSEAKKILADLIANYLNTLQQTDSSFDFKYKREIVLDLLYSSLAFALENNFNAEKTSCVVELAYRVFYDSMTKVLSFEKAFEVCKSYLLRHALFRPPHSIILFSLEEIKAILSFFKWNFLKNYGMLLKTFTPEISYEIETFNLFKGVLPANEKLASGESVNKDELSILDMFNKDKEIKLTKEEMEEIMRGNSIHNIPEWKRQEIIRKHLEQERQGKIDRAMEKELAKLQQYFDEEITKQDQEFEKRVSEIGKKK